MMEILKIKMDALTIDWSKKTGLERKESFLLQIFAQKA